MRKRDHIPCLASWWWIMYQVWNILLGYQSIIANPMHIPIYAAQLIVAFIGGNLLLNVYYKILGEYPYEEMRSM